MKLENFRMLAADFGAASIMTRYPVAVFEGKGLVVSVEVAEDATNLDVIQALHSASILTGEGCLT